MLKFNVALTGKIKEDIRALGAFVSTRRIDQVFIESMYAVPKDFRVVEITADQYQEYLVAVETPLFPKQFRLTAPIPPPPAFDLRSFKKKTYKIYND